MTKKLKASKQFSQSNPEILDSLASNSSNSLPRQKKKKCGLILKGNLSIWNALTIFFLMYMVSLGYMMGANFFTILIQDKNYYQISKEELGTVSGSFTTYTTIITLPLTLMSGIILDNCGRKVPISLLCFLAAAMLAILPYGGDLYPGLFVIRTLLMIGLEIIVVAPLLADYVDHSTKGLAGGYIQLALGVQTSIFSFVFLQLAESIDLAYISWMAGALALLISIYSSIFILNMYAKDTRSSLVSSTLSNSQNEQEITCCQRVLANFTYGCRISRERKMLIAVYLISIASRVLDMAYMATISLWVSKYVYNGDISQISYHNKLLLGVSHAVCIPLGVAFGFLYDKCGEFTIVPLTFFLSGAPYIALYFMTDLDSVIAYTLQIFAAVFSVLCNGIGVIITARHSPPQGAGKIFALRSFIGGVFTIGYGYLNGWIIDQDFNKAVFLMIAAIALSITLMFICIRLCCKSIAEIPKEEEEIFMLASEQN